MNKNILLIGIIVIVNLVFITIPYSIENKDIARDINSINSSQRVENENTSYDFNLIRENIYDNLEKLNIKGEITMSQEGDILLFEIRANINRMQFFNLLSLMNLEETKGYEIINMDVSFNNEESNISLVWKN